VTSGTTTSGDRRLAKPARIGLLWNPAAGAAKRRPELLQRIQDELALHAYREAVTPEEVGEALAQLAAQGVDTLIISGGDGTIQAVMSCLFAERPFDELPAVVLLPSGTTNMDARDIGVRGRPQRALTHLRRRGGPDLSGLTVRERPVLRISHGSHCLHGFFFGTGLIAEAVDYFQNRIRRWSALGELGSLLASVRTLVSVLVRRREPIPMTLDWGDGRPRGGGWALVMMTSLERVLFRSRPYHAIGTGDGYLTAARYPLRRALTALMRERTAGDEAERRGLCSRRVDSLTLNMNGSYIVDGETYSANEGDGPVTVTIAEERIRFLVPG
jgi:diacylglycerol kinase family enzyme